MVETGLPVARELAEMLLIKHDLSASLSGIKIWDRLRKMEAEDTEDNKSIRNSLLRDGITQFVNCFDGKNFSPLVVETIYQSWEGIGPYFRWLRGLRNSYTAHRHGSARQCVVGALVDPVTGGFIGPAHFLTLWSGPSPDGLAQLLSVIERAVAYADLQIQILGLRFTEEASSIAPEDLLKLPAACVQIQDPTAIGKSRGDIRKAMAQENASPSVSLPPKGNEVLQ